MADYATLLFDHVTLTYRSVDRIFLQAYVPKLQSVGEHICASEARRIDQRHTYHRLKRTWSDCELRRDQAWLAQRVNCACCGLTEANDPQIANRGAPPTVAHHRQRQVVLGIGPAAGAT